jgi:hypothetical protein
MMGTRGQKAVRIPVICAQFTAISEEVFDDDLPFAFYENITE